MESHGMLAHGDAGAGKVGDKPLLDRHLPQRGRLGCLLRKLIQQRSCGTPGVLHLPQRIAAVCHLAQRVERADLGQQREIALAQLGHAQRQILNRCECALLSRRDQSDGRLSPQSARIAEAQAHREAMFIAGLRAPACRANRSAARPPALRVSHGAAHPSQWWQASRNPSAGC